ncbi:MAG: hypothetical protein V3T58_06015 [Candidatus Hydrothermarchaeales archaeon]
MRDADLGVEALKILKGFKGTSLKRDFGISSRSVELGVGGHR